MMHTMAGVLLLAGLSFSVFFCLVVEEIALMTFFLWLLTLAVWYGFG